jgi:hypothetical protein
MLFRLETHRVFRHGLTIGRAAAVAADRASGGTAHCELKKRALWQCNACRTQTSLPPIVLGPQECLAMLRSLLHPASRTTATRCASSNGRGAAAPRKITCPDCGLVLTAARGVPRYKLHMTSRSGCVVASVVTLATPCGALSIVTIPSQAMTMVNSLRSMDDLQAENVASVRSRAAKGPSCRKG